MAGEVDESPNTRRARQTEKKLRDNAAMEEIWSKIPKEIIRPTVNRATGKTEKVHFKRGAFLGKVTPVSSSLRAHCLTRPGGLRSSLRAARCEDREDLCRQNHL